MPVLLCTASTTAPLLEGMGSLATSSSRVAMTKKAGRSSMSLSASVGEPLPEGVRVAKDFGLLGRDNEGRSACNVVRRERHDASHRGDEGRQRRGSQDRQQQQRLEGLQRRRPRAPRSLSRRGRGPPKTSASWVVTTKAGIPVTSCTASSTAPLPEGVRDAGDVDLTSGDDEEGRSACNAVVCKRHGTSRTGAVGH